MCGYKKAAAPRGRAQVCKRRRLRLPWHTSSSSCSAQHGKLQGATSLRTSIHSTSVSTDGYFQPQVNKEGNRPHASTDHFPSAHMHECLVTAHASAGNDAKRGPDNPEHPSVTQISRQSAKEEFTTHLCQQKTDAPGPLRHCHAAQVQL
jgi:hypothetical protein